jgi:hypothetical protein
MAGENGGSHPGPGETSPLFYSYYANRVRGDRAPEEPAEGKLEEEPARKRRCIASWARLIAKVFHADPLTCRKCGGKLKIVAYLHDQVAIKQVLAHLGLSPPEAQTAAGRARGRARTRDEEGREMEAP